MKKRPLEEIRKEQYAVLTQLIKTMSVGDAAKEMGVSRTTAHNIMYAFHSKGFKIATKKRGRKPSTQKDRKDRMRCACGCGAKVLVKDGYTKQCYSDVLRKENGFAPAQIYPTIDSMMAGL